MLASIEKRVRCGTRWSPFYSDATSGAGKEVESRNAESVLNAIILSSYDRAARPPERRRRARRSTNAWALQSTSGADAGAWVWQNFHYTPWESPESEYHGAALMAVAVGKAPDDYRDDAKIAANLAALTGYLPATTKRSRC
jgi:squalene-hopene/tetraprenyl-beta-curcumene cyclase